MDFSRVVTPDWLADHLSDPDLVVGAFGPRTSPTTTSGSLRWSASQSGVTTREKSMRGT